ncbi:MAG: adenylate/guanylate cyclase domain-containing protein [Acidimicrobiales bacterium]|nr:adenylate/guanylate cyclase domain-containing protein [Acidimicrobiales bacterium]MDG1846750.1 adenylate/guanylate cyclase domain-containing protein [Acidimicrobiales bacterium]
MIEENPYEDRFDRTFAFIDLSGFTSFTDLWGDKAAVEVLDDFRSLVRTVASRKGIRIAKWLGDGAMLVAVEPETATEAIMEMQESMVSSDAPLELRAGLASGPVLLVDGEDYLGRAVNMAARLCDRAVPGEVLATSSMITSLMVNTPSTPIGKLDLKGFKESVEIVRLTLSEKN